MKFSDHGCNYRQLHIILKISPVCQNQTNLNILEKH